ncbi:MAG: lipopolysaccharide assembly protein LapB [Gammaproteobacteria bacterium]|nr:lipopolysaccharide assembly protein LapB [Gammaproteobacteria bacterium]
MDYEFLIVGALLFVAVISGWLLGRRTLQSDAGNNRFIMHPEYFKGLNYVLNEQPDKAIEVFVKMLEVDSETVETHLALGNLFRRRGEVDRAIRIHQNLIARPSLEKDQRALALLELGMDYMRSGLLDRAESLFNELIEMGMYRKQAYRELLDIYQQEKDWDKAITTARKLENVTAESLAHVIAQFYCEQAADHLRNGRMSQFRERIGKALTNDPDCVRASIMTGNQELKSGNVREALKAYKRIESQDIDFISEVIAPMHECYKSNGKMDEFIEFLRKITEQTGSITALLTLVRLIAERDGEDEASRLIITELRKRPSVRGVDRLLEFALHNTSGETRDSLLTIKDLTGELLKNRSAYRCNQCGFEAKALHWQCPGCKTWSSVKPIYGIEGE